jgi:hypothetical protein
MAHSLATPAINPNPDVESSLYARGSLPVAFDFAHSGATRALADY